MIYVIGFLLSTLLSNYYWGVYVLVMGDYPNVSSFFAYFGWNLSFLVLAAVSLIHMPEEEKKHFSPLALLPVPINIIQFLVWLPFGGVGNSIWQGALSTVVACVSLNSIIYYLKNKKTAVVPVVAIVSLLFITMEYIMWTSSCFDWPGEWAYPYNYAMILDYLYYLALPLSVAKSYGDKLGRKDDGEQNIFRGVFRFFYITLIVGCCVGGCIIALWMRDTLSRGIGEVGDTDPYSVIAVMLFVVSVVILLITATVILMAGLSQKSREGLMFKEAKSVAERANAAKSDFLANMSHEIRTPINAVLGMNEMILRESLEARDDPPADKEEISQRFASICNYSGNVDSAGKNLLSLINDILDFSKIEAGKMDIIDNDYRLSHVLNDVINMILFKAQAKGLVFEVEVEADTPDLLFGDELRVHQIITNMLNNAVKYTDIGNITLSVRTVDTEEKKKEGITDLVISVKDTGIGIKEEDLEKLFGKFERVDILKNSGVEGTGLGLAITKSLLDMMGGTISVKSVYGVGSEFTAVIPQKVTKAEPIGDFRERFRDSIREMKAKKRSLYAPLAKILVVDDTPMNLEVVSFLLKDSGIDTDTADSGARAIELASGQKYDIIFMDQRMPGMDGVAAMHKIKEAEDGPNRKTPVICLTADAVSGAKEHYISEGFEDYLTKPIDSAALEEMIMTYLPEDKLE